MGGAPRLYVIGEIGESTPVKIGITEGGSARSMRAGLRAGNWRRLEVLGTLQLPVEDLRWSEWLIHRRLLARHIRGEWFDVRSMVPDCDWERFVERVIAADPELSGLEAWELTNKHGHALAHMKRIGSGKDRRQFVATCTCGQSLDGGPGSAMATVQRQFAIDHLGLDPRSEVVRSLAIQVHHMDHGQPRTPAKGDPTDLDLAEL